MDLGLKGKVALVTGATQGMGRAIAEAFAGEGADIAICSREAGQAAEMVMALEASGVKAFGDTVDIADGAALKAFVGRAGDALGGVDILVSNASAMMQGNDEDAWKAMFDIDMMGAVRVFEAARPLLEAAAGRNGDAAFLIISSIHAAETDNPSCFGAIKAAQIHFAKGVAREMAPKRVRCNVVSPGTILFEDGVWGSAKRNAPVLFERAIKRNPTGRMGTLEEVAAATLFLASPRSSFTTGVNMMVDGGLTRRVNF